MMHHGTLQRPSLDLACLGGRVTGLTTVVRIAVENDRYRAVDDLPLRIPEGGVRTHQVYDSGILTSFEKTIQMLSSLDITLSCQVCLMMSFLFSSLESFPFSSLRT